MPLYEYKCDKCDNKFETLVSFRNAGNPVECPKCGSRETSKLMSTFCANAGGNTTSASSSASCGSGGT